MNKLPDDVKQVIFEYFATTCKEIAVLELLNKQVWQPRLFQNNKQATFWQHLLTKKLCIPSTDQIHAKQILKKYHSHQFDLVADQDILDFINWVNDDRHYYEEEDIYLQLLGKDCQGKHALVLQTALAMGVQTNIVNKFFDIRDVPHVDGVEQKLGPNLNTCYIVAFELHNMESFQIATNYLRTLQKQLYCIKLPAMLVGLQCSTPVNSTTTTGTNSSMAIIPPVVTAQMIHELTASCGNIPYAQVPEFSIVPQQYLDIIGVWAIQYCAYSHALAFPGYSDNFKLKHSPKFLHCDIPQTKHPIASICILS